MIFVETAKGQYHIQQLVNIQKHIAESEICFVETTHSETLCSGIFQFRHINNGLIVFRIAFLEVLDTTDT